MFGIETLTGNAHAAAVVGLVFAQAAVLYAGYGALTRIATPTVRSVVGDQP